MTFENDAMPGAQFFVNEQEDSACTEAWPHHSLLKVLTISVDAKSGILRRMSVFLNIRWNRKKKLQTHHLMKWQCPTFLLSLAHGVLQSCCPCDANPPGLCQTSGRWRAVTTPPNRKWKICRWVLLLVINSQSKSTVSYCTQDEIIGGMAADPSFLPEARVENHKSYRVIALQALHFWVCFSQAPQVQKYLDEARVFWGRSSRNCRELLLAAGWQQVG